MGRLFWKFFLSILLAQITATVGIGGALWLRDRAHQQDRLQDIDTSPIARLAIDAAAATLEFGGIEALRRLLGNMERQRVFAVDETGRELLGRIVSQAMLVEARYVHGQADKRSLVRDMAAKDGHRYLLFLPSREHQPGFDAGFAAGPLAALIGAPPHLYRPGPWPLAPRVFGAARAADAADGHAGGQAGPPSDPASTPPGPPPEARRPFGDPRYRAAILLGAATLASLLFAFLLAWYFSRPIRALRQAFEAASGGDLAPRFGRPEARRGDELSDLGRDFDRMTDRLRQLIDGQTRLLHDVSHELRSPLARLQAAIGLAHQQPEQMATSMERIERECVRMDKLVGELLTLSRLEAGAPHPMSEDISMADLIDEIIGDASFEAAACRRRVVLSGGADVLVRGQADLLGRAIENVVRNAIKHSPVDGVVLLELAARDGGRVLAITVSDRGSGVAPAELESIFTPFFRSADKHNTTEGHGLGLAIARHVVQAHGGAIEAANRDGGGLCVVIVLPVAPA